jgi:hypothetical protein
MSHNEGMTKTQTTKTPYAVAIVDTVVWPHTENRVMHFASGGEAVAWLTEEWYNRRYGRLNAQMQQEADIALSLLDRWRGEPTSFGGTVYRAYLLPGSMTWQQYEDQIAIERSGREKARRVKLFTRILEESNAVGTTEVEDPADYARRAVEAGVSLTDLRSRLRVLA